MYYKIKVVQHVCLQSGRSLEHCILLNVGCLGKTLIVYFITATFYLKKKYI